MNELRFITAISEDKLQFDDDERAIIRQISRGGSQNPDKLSFWHTSTTGHFLDSNLRSDVEAATCVTGDS